MTSELRGFAGKRNALELLDEIGFPRRSGEQAAKLGALVDVHANDLKAQLARWLLADQHLRADLAQSSLDLHGSVRSGLEAIVRRTRSAPKAQRLNVHMRLAARSGNGRA